MWNRNQSPKFLEPLITIYFSHKDGKEQYAYTEYIQLYYTYPRVTASLNDIALALPSCLQAVFALFLVNPSMQIVPH